VTASQKPLLIVAICLIVVGSGLLFRFGTLSPCGMLRQELKAAFLQSAVEKKATSTWEMAGIGLGAAIVGPLIDNLVSSLTPMQCTRALVRLKLEGKNIFANELAKTGQASPKYGTSQSSPTPPPQPDWRVRTEKSPLDDSTNVHVSIDAEKPVSGWLGVNVTPSLPIRCKENKTNAYIHLGMRPKTEYGGYEGEYTSITLRFDEEKAYQEKLGLSTSGEAVFFPDHIAIAKKMMKHKRLLIEFIPSNASPQITTFNLQGLPEKVVQLREACRW
jgi:type VI secretion system protein VasI